MAGPQRAWRIRTQDATTRKATRPPPPPISRTRKVLRRIRELFQILFIVLAALAIGMVANTFRQHKSPQAPAPPPPPDHVDPAVVAQHLAAAIRSKTISHEDPAQDDAAELLGLRKLLETTYPKVHASLTREIVNGKAILFTWKGSDESLRPALFAAHMDVVPVEPGSEKTWAHPPFEGAIADGFVWGRGALDDKGSLVCLLEAAESLLAEGFRPKRTLLFALGFDEEVGGAEGATKIAAALKEKAVFLESVVDEGMAVTQGIFPDVALPVAMIGTAEKGFLTVELTVETEGGHSSMPPAQSAIGILASAVSRVERAPMPARLEGAPRQAIETLSPYMPFSRRVVTSNLWITEPLLAWMSMKKPSMNAVMRTTTAPTIFEAGVKENVLASKARAVLNFRVLSGDSTDGVIAHVRAAVADGRVNIARIGRTLSEPSTTSSSDSPAYRRIETAIRTYFPDALVVPGLVVGATDSRHYALLAENVYRFAPFTLRTEDLRRIHGTDERVGVADLGLAVRAYRFMLQN